jgi:hypothetical protein
MNCKPHFLQVALFVTISKLAELEIRSSGIAKLSGHSPKKKKKLINLKTITLLKRKKEKFFT